jgi:hypothetical protein
MQPGSLPDLRRLRVPAAGLVLARMSGFDDYMEADAVLAAVDLAGRTGAKSCEIGFLHEGVPVGEAGWYAAALYKGARITVDDHPGPVEAADALARRLLAGGRCIRCGRRIRLSGQSGAGCRWRRFADHWQPSCGPTP